MKVFCCSLIVIAAVAVTPLFSNGPAHEGSPRETSAAGGSSWVCVVNKVTETDARFCTYNATRCKDGSKGSLDNKACNLVAGNCSNAMNDSNCFDVPDTTFEESSGHPVTGDLAESGLAKPLDEDFELKTFNNAKIVLNELVQIDTPDGKKIMVRLFLVRAFDAKQKFFQVIGQGAEVKSIKAPAFVVPNDAKMTTFKGKVCYLNLRGARYTVILNTKVGGQDQKEEEPPLLDTEFANRVPVLCPTRHGGAKRP